MWSAGPTLPVWLPRSSLPWAHFTSFTPSNAQVRPDVVAFPAALNWFRHAEEIPSEGDEWRVKSQQRPNLKNRLANTGGAVRWLFRAVTVYAVQLLTWGKWHWAIWFIPASALCCQEAPQQAARRPYGGRWSDSPFWPWKSRSAACRAPPQNSFSTTRFLKKVGHCKI